MRSPFLHWSSSVSGPFRRPALLSRFMRRLGWFVGVGGLLLVGGCARWADSEAHEWLDARGYKNYAVDCNGQGQCIVALSEHQALVLECGTNGCDRSGCTLLVGGAMP